MSIWQKLAGPRSPKGASIAYLKAPPPAPEMNIHSMIGGNGQHLVLPPRTGGHPWIGHNGKAPQLHPFAPAETFQHTAGGINMPPSTPLQATVPAVVNSLTGQAAGTYQLAPGGGVNMPGVQRAPGRAGR